MSKQNSPNPLQHAITEFDIALTPAHLDLFERYYEELMKWNQRISLTAITDYEDVQIRHFADSLAVLLALEADAESEITLIDIGTGAGFPGLPLKLLRPAWQVVLLDSTRKKTEFIEHTIYRLDLDDATAVWARAEEIAQDPVYRAQFDVAVARAVADVAVLCEYALPLLRTGGQFVAQKGTDPEEELQAARGALEVLGGVYRDTIPYRLPGFDDPLNLIVIEKVAATPEKYPRRPGMPEKRPIS